MSKKADGAVLNGSVTKLAEAFRDVFLEWSGTTYERVSEDIKEVKEGMVEMESRIKKDVNDHIDTTNQNLQSQLADQEKRLRQDIKNIRV